jgi:hypothetical protein
MVRVMAAVAAWAAGTAIAVSVAWFGANVVVRNAGVGPGMPVINAAVLPPSATPSAATTPAPAIAPSGSAAPGRTPVAHPPATGRNTSPGGPSVTPSAAGVHAYALAGGQVTLDMAGGSVQLVSAVPDVGYSVQTWSGTGWLRVDFSSGAQVSSLIASWYEHAPEITVTN